MTSLTTMEAATPTRFTVVSARTDCLWHAIDGEHLTEDETIALMACNRKIAESKHLWTADGELIPYLSVMRWFMLPAPVGLLRVPPLP